MHAAAAMKTDADAPTDAMLYRSYERHKKLQLHYNKLAYAAREPREKGENDSGEFIRHRGCKFTRGHQKSAIYRGVKAKVPIIGAFKGS